MSARTAHDHFKAAAAQGFGHNRVRARAIENHAVGDRILPAWRGKNVPHPTQIAFALFAHIANKNKRQRVPHPHRTQQCGNREHRRHARAVIGNSRPIQSAALLANVQRRVRRKHSIDVRAQRHIALSESGMQTEHVAHIIDANIIEGDFAKALGQPCPACRLAKRRRRNPRHLHLPLRQLRLLRTQPVERRPHLRQRSHTRHVLLHRRRNVRHIRARRNGAHGKFCHLTTRGKVWDWLSVDAGCEKKLRQLALHISRSLFYCGDELLCR